MGGRREPDRALSGVVGFDGVGVAAVLVDARAGRHRIVLTGLRGPGSLVLLLRISHGGRVPPRPAPPSPAPASPCPVTARPRPARYVPVPWGSGSAGTVRTRRRPSSASAPSPWSRSWSGSGPTWSGSRGSPSPPS